MSERIIPTGWFEKPLGKLAEPRRGITYSASMLDAEQGGLPYVNMKSFLKGGGFNQGGTKAYSGVYSPADLVGATDLLIANTDVTSGDIVGVPALLPADFDVCNVLYSHHVTRLRLNEEILVPFLYYLLCLPEYRSQMLRVARGTTVLMLDMQAIKRIPIRAPILQTTQSRIAEILSTVDEAIKGTESLIAKLQKVKAGLMQDLFTRGVTPGGKLRPPREEAPDLYQESPLGWIPKGWTHAPLRKFAPTAVYGISTSLNDDPTGIPVLRMNNISDGKIDTSDVKYSNAAIPPNLFLRNNDVLFNRTNSLEHVGKTAIWNGELFSASFASYLVRLQVDQTYMTPLFLTCWLNLSQTQLDMRRFATPGVHQVNINPTNLRRMLCSAPRDLDEQVRITDKVEATESLILKTEENLAKLRQQKQGLMQDLLTGRVSVHA